jgi:hypothetical protein
MESTMRRRYTVSKSAMGLIDRMLSRLLLP